MRSLYDSCIGRQESANSSGNDDAAKTSARDLVNETIGGQGKSSKAVCDAEMTEATSDQGEDKEQMEKVGSPPQFPAARGAKAGPGRGRGRGGAAKKKSVDAKGKAKAESGRGRGASKQALNPAGQSVLIYLGPIMSADFE